MISNKAILMSLVVGVVSAIVLHFLVRKMTGGDVIAFGLPLVGGILLGRATYSVLNEGSNDE